MSRGERFSSSIEDLVDGINGCADPTGAAVRGAPLSTLKSFVLGKIC
jgi:hypothetical protein